MIQFIENLGHYHPKNTYSEFVKKYFLAMTQDWTKAFIQNLDVKIAFLEVDDFLVPISFDNEKIWNCYVSSLLGMLEYLFWESKMVKNTFAQFILKKISIFSQNYVIKNKLYENIYINNFLLSTNLYPDFSQKHIDEIKDFLIEKYPHHALIFRSINTQNEKLFSYFCNWKHIASRQVFISTQEDAKEYFHHRNLKNDKRVFEKSGYEFVVKKEYSQEELKEIVSAYNYLYLERYTDLNPQFSIHFLENITKEKIFTLWVLQKNGQIDACLWYYGFWEECTTPIFWYNSFDKKKSLYSQISYLLIKTSLEKYKILNQSSWAGWFKMGRGAKKYLEYMMVYSSHLSKRKQRFWNIFEFISKHLWEKLLKNNVY